MAGPNVAQSIDRTTGRLFSPGHVFCKASDNKGYELTIGYSSGSKIWSSKFELIPDYIKWCDSCGNKIANNSLTVKTNTNYDYLPMPSKLEIYPEKIIFCFFSNQTFSSPPTISDENGNLTQNLLIDSSIKIIKQEDKCLTLEISIENMTEIIECDIKGVYKCVNPSIYIKNGHNILSLSDYLNNFPLTFKVSNGTIIIENELLESNEKIPIFSHELIKSINWENYNTDITCEFGNPINAGKKSIHNTLDEILSEKQ